MTTETNAEFLERMKQKAYTKMIFLAVQVDMPDLKRLIQQAERAQEAEFTDTAIERRSLLGSLKECDEENSRLRELVKILKLHATHCDADGRAIQPYEIIDVINEFMAGEISGQR